MYYRVNGVIEEYSKPPVNKKEVTLTKQSNLKHSNGTGFPFWLLILIIVVVVGIALWFLYTLRGKRQGQDFGFRFY